MNGKHEYRKKNKPYPRVAATQTSKNKPFIVSLEIGALKRKTMYVLRRVVID